MEFWLIASVLIALAVALAAWPLLKPQTTAAHISDEAGNVSSFHDQIAELDQQVEQGLVTLAAANKLKLELQKKLADELNTEQNGTYSLLKKPVYAGLIALMVPLFAVLLYFRLGATTEMAVVDAIRQGDLNEQVLQNWVAKQPENNQALYMLGSHYLRAGKLDEAITTYRQLASISNGHPQVSAELAQVLFLSNNNIVTAEVRNLYEQALSQDGQNTTALGLQGIDAYSNGDYAKALAVWQQALAVEEDPVARQSLSAGINQARTMLGDQVVAVRVMVDMAPELDNIPANARIVVFARPAGEDKTPPVAAVPLRVADLPRVVILDDSSTMSGQLLSSLEQLDITARLSLTGDVMSADYQVQVKGVKTSLKEPVRLTFTPAS